MWAVVGVRLLVIALAKVLIVTLVEALVVTWLLVIVLLAIDWLMAKVLAKDLVIILVVDRLRLIWRLPIPLSLRIRCHQMCLLLFLELLKLVLLLKLLLTPSELERAFIVVARHVCNDGAFINVVRLGSLFFNGHGTFFRVLGPLLVFKFGVDGDVIDVCRGIIVDVHYLSGCHVQRNSRWGGIFVLGGNSGRGCLCRLVGQCKRMNGTVPVNIIRRQDVDELDLPSRSLSGWSSTFRWWCVSIRAIVILLSCRVQDVCRAGKCIWLKR